MSVKYHVNPDTGESGVCRSESGKCPFRGESGLENHYSTAAEAQAAGNKTMLEQHGLFSVNKRKESKTDTDSEEESEVLAFEKELKLDSQLHVANLRAELSIKDFFDGTVKVEELLDEKRHLSVVTELAGENNPISAFGDNDRITVRGSNRDGTKEFELLITRNENKPIGNETLGKISVYHIGNIVSRKMDKTISKILDNGDSFIELMDLKRAAVTNHKARVKIREALKNLKKKNELKHPKPAK